VTILIDILHPAHVHFFRHAIAAWQGRSHEIHITLRDKDVARVLLERHGLPYHNLGPARAGTAGLAMELARRNLKLWRIAQRVRPDVMAGIGGISVAQVGWLTGIPSVVFTDTENATLSNRLTFPFATAVCTPSCFERRLRHRHHVTYEGYHELAYLHPKRFAPNPSRLATFGLQHDDPFIVMRLVSWKAAHDRHDHGFTDVRHAVRRLARFGRVLISAEAGVPADLAAHRVTAAPEQMHHLLAYARLYIGESATMASESALLGTPAIFVSTSTRGYTNELGRRYGLVHTYSDATQGQEKALRAAEAILGDRDCKRQWQLRRDRLLQEKIDVTSFVVDLVEQYGSPDPRRC